jgi:hypothetical protein
MHAAEALVTVYVFAQPTRTDSQSLPTSIVGTDGSAAASRLVGV